MKGSMTVRLLAVTLALIVCTEVCGGASSLAVDQPICEYKTNPLGIDVVRPRLGWKIVAARRGTTQTAYHIRAAERIEDLRSGQNLLWDSGKTRSDRSVHVVYGGPPCASRRRVWWQVRVWDKAC
ncbi:MAG: glycoside hydrolase family 78 protein [Planctomycetota bacterium]|jgi:alpha-L-rhamnosidase